MSQKYDYQSPPPQGGPPPQYPPQAHQDAGPMQPYYQNGPPGNADYYGNQGPPQGYPQQGYPQQGYGYQQPPPNMQYQQPQGGYVDNRKGDSGAGGGLFAGLCAGLACCCCLDCLF